MFQPIRVNLSEKDKNNNNGCHISTNTINVGVLQDLARTLNPNSFISRGTINSPQPSNTKKKRNLPGNPDPNAEVIALSPNSLLATNRFVCEICQKGFQRDQNLQLHRRGHNLPWKLKQRSTKEIRKRAYVCPEPTCVHHNPSRALGDLTGIKKHFCRKHGEKKWKCEKCSKIYAVQPDWKAHSKICGSQEYKCDCGTLFTRKDSFITHRAFCDALAQESARISASNALNHSQTPTSLFPFPPLPTHHHFFSPNTNPIWDPPLSFFPPHLSDTALLQKAASCGSRPEIATWRKENHLTRDFLGSANEDQYEPTWGYKLFETRGDMHNTM